MQNPVQIKKSIRGKSEDFGFPLGEISGYTDKFSIEFMSKKLNDIPKGSSVFSVSYTHLRAVDKLRGAGAVLVPLKGQRGDRGTVERDVQRARPLRIEIKGVHAL